MFERLTEKASRTIFYAHYEAGQHGAAAIEPSQILLGLVHSEEHLASAFIARVHEQVMLRREIESNLEIRPRVGGNVEMPLAKESKLTLEHAVREAKEMGHSQIGTGHLFLGILEERESLSARILAHHNLDAPTIRQAVASLPPSSPAPFVATAFSATATPVPTTGAQHELPDPTPRHL